MEANLPRRHPAPLALAASGAVFSALAVIDKVFGLVQHPQYLATAAYVCLAGLLVWTCVRGIHLRTARFLRPSVYAGFLILNILTAAYVFALKVSADPTPLLLRTRLNQGDAMLARGDKDEALLLYRETYQTYPSSFQVLMRMGAVNYQLGDFEHAQRYFSKALENASPDNRWRALNDLGQSYWKLHRPEEAIHSYLEAQKAGMPSGRPEMIEWHYRLGWAYFDVKDYDKAIAHYQAVGNLHAKYAAASFYNVACAYAQKWNNAPDVSQRQQFAEKAVEALREAQKETEPAEMPSFREGLLGSPQERDPELEPLRNTPEFAAYVRELKAS